MSEGQTVAELGGATGQSMALATVPVEERGLRGLQLAEEMFTPAQREQVAALLTVPKDSPALMPFLALCVAEGFSPWANHVWLIPKKVKVPAQNGDGEVEETKHIPAVGRDGLLHKARQSPQFEDLDFGVVCERDTFEAWRDPESREWKVMHRFAPKPTEFGADEAPDRWRGRVIGAWALLYLKGKRPTYYYANLREHGRMRDVWAWNDEARGRRPIYHAPNGGVTFAGMSQVGEQMVQNRPVQEWEGAWSYLSTMILKAAQSYVCRIGLGVTGFLPADEMRNVEEWAETPERGPQPVAAPAPDTFDFEQLDAPEELRERLQRAVDEANGQGAFHWPPAKCEMVMFGRTADELTKVAEQIERENALRAERLAGDAGEEEKITDADVVEADAETERLRHRVADLLAAIEATEDEAEEAALRAELDQVEAELSQREQ